MKQLTKVFFIVAFTLISGIAMASGNLKVLITQGAEDEAIVQINNAVSSIFEIQVQNEKGDVVFYKQTQNPSTSYSNVYDFSKLEDGVYSFWVEINNESSHSKLSINNGSVKLIEQDKEVDPFFALKNKRLEITYLNFDKSDIMLYVYEQGSNRLLHEENIGSEFALSHALDLSELRSGTYEAVLVSDQAIHEYNININ